MNVFININRALHARFGRVAMPAPAHALAVIGDVHGRADLLGAMLEQLARDHSGYLPVLAGDLVDRGPDSRAVLERVRMPGAGIVVLMGNHERMLLDFLDDPGAAGPAWLRHGGDATLASFGIAKPEPDSATRDALRAALGPAEAWLRALPTWWQSGTVVVAHAGADPRRAMADQDPRDLLWGHPGFGRFPRRDGLWVVRGHVIVPEPQFGRGVISVDTGACTTGRLSCALISGEGVRFLTVGS